MTASYLVPDTALDFRLDDVKGPAIQALLLEHLADMHQQSPAESVHAFDFSRLQQPDMRMWSLWHGPKLIGCGAWKRHSPTMAELKSMRTRSEWRGQGLGSKILAHLVQDAKTSGITDLYLETGSTAYFAPAIAMYLRHGFVECGPFASYVDDPFSRFFHVKL